ncbi:tetraacyldisaccharide 4'-kinase [Spirosoma taeanense]|uniref:tetraacyldisaccharide 4'-kinase n=1 Tax=Spirosoma taeanense TaxID=2735870 RepID=UPI00293BEA37|nr:tetraacyldisaccharide 4'-kinase [Spirosoma taeanense]
MLFLILLPFSRIYGLITGIRNLLYNRGLFESFKPDILTVSVGNITVGGTGKTPMIEYLIKRHRADKSVRPFDLATLSRGYGRRTTGFRITQDQDTAETVGDEPLQLYRKFGRRVRVVVGERRADAIQHLQRHYPEVRRVLLDDAFQHRAVQPHLNLLLTDYNRPFYADHPFPAGRLRENRHGARRADAVIVTKCPGDLTVQEQDRIQVLIRPYIRPETPIFFAGLRYGRPVPFGSVTSAEELRDVVLVSGLANADLLEQYVQQVFVLWEHFRFADHYAYTRADLDRLLSRLAPGVGLLTTEKDRVKLDALLTPDERNRLPLYSLPIEVEFLPGYEAKFDELLQTTGY